MIDDSEVARDDMTRLLRDAGCDVFSRESAIGASAEIVQHQIGVVVLDVQMPVMGGERFAELIRQNERLRHVKLILVSSDRAALLAAADRVHADAAIPKHEIPSLLVSTVEGLAGAEEAAPERLGVLVSGAQFVLPRIGAWTIGRGEDCDLVIDDEDASRTHARFVIGPEGVTIEDLDSKNGTQLNFEAVRAATPVSPRDEITIGQTHLLVFDPRHDQWRKMTETFDDLEPPEE